MQARVFATDITQVSLFTGEVTKTKLEEISNTSRPVSFEHTIADFNNDFKFCDNQLDVWIRIFVPPSSYLKSKEKKLEFHVNITERSD